MVQREKSGGRRLENPKNPAKSTVNAPGQRAKSLQQRAPTLDFGAFGRGEGLVVAQGGVCS